MTRILYLHGFASSGDSTKALLLKKYIEDETSKTEILIPNLENNIADAFEQIDSLIKSTLPTALIGSSLGGFFGTYFSEKYNLKCVGINPAVMPPADMSDHLGENKNYSTGEKFIIDQDQLNLLNKMSKQISNIKHRDNFMVFLQSKDEILDYRAALSFYQSSIVDVTFGGNHSFENFESCFNKIKIFLNMH